MKRRGVFIALLALFVASSAHADDANPAHDAPVRYPIVRFAIGPILGFGGSFRARYPEQDEVHASLGPSAGLHLRADIAFGDHIFFSPVLDWRSIRYDGAAERGDLYNVALGLAVRHVFRIRPKLAIEPWLGIELGVATIDAYYIGVRRPVTAVVDYALEDSSAGFGLGTSARAGVILWPSRTLGVLMSFAYRRSKFRPRQEADIERGNALIHHASVDLGFVIGVPR